MTVRRVLLIGLMLALVLTFFPAIAQEMEKDPAALIELIRQGGEARVEARQQLIALGEVAVPALIEATRDEDVWVRWEAVNALGCIEDPRGIPALVERALIDDNPHPRWRSLWAVSVFPGEDFLPGLRKGLDSEDSTVVWNAVIALAFFAQPEIVPQLNEALVTATGFPHWEAVFSLGQVHDENSVKLLMELVQDLDQELRIRQEAANTLGKIADPEAIPALIAALGDPEMGVQWRAASALKRIGDPEVTLQIEAAVGKLETTLAELQVSLAETQEETEIRRIESQIKAMEFAIDQMQEALSILDPR